MKYFSVSHGYLPLCSAYMVSRVIAITLPAQASDIMSWFVQSQLADISSATFRGMYLPAEEWFMTNISLFVVALLRFRRLSRTKAIVYKRKQVLINIALTYQLCHPVISTTSLFLYILVSSRELRELVDIHPCLTLGLVCFGLSDEKSGSIK